jgi:hypothetical protein
VSGGSARSPLTLTSQPLWRIRLARELPRYLIFAVSLAGLAASARYAIAPPSSAAPVVREAPAPADQAAEAFAVLFARRYLTWNGAEPQESSQSVAAFAGPGLEQGAGVELPPGGSQRVEWAEVAQTRAPATNEHVYTIAAQTEPGGLIYLTVGVIRTPDGSLALGGYPAFVGPPAAEPAPPPPHLREVEDPALATVVERALRNYLAGSAGELAADLTSEARVSLPMSPLVLESLQRLGWSPDGRSVTAVVRARDARGVHYTLAYELDVAREQGRWEIAAVQTDPTG